MMLAKWNMKKAAMILIFAITLMSFAMTSSVFADRNYRVHSPRGTVITLVITESVLRNVRIYGFDISEDGNIFSITAAPLRRVDTTQTLLISFYKKDTVVESDYAYFDPGKTTQEVDCPEEFDRIVVEH